jgi:hypothetical protein
MTDAYRIIKEQGGEVDRLKSENAELKRLLRQTISRYSICGIVWEWHGNGGELEYMDIRLPGSWVREVQKAVGEPMPEGVDVR